MTDRSPGGDRHRLSRRTVLRAGTAATAASAVSVAGASSVLGQTETATDNGDGGGGDDTDDRYGWLAIDEFRAGAIFRVESPRIPETPILEGPGGPDPQSASQRVIQYFNTGEEAVLYLAGDSDVEQGTIYRLARDFQLSEDDPGPQLVRTGFERYPNQNLAMDLAETDVSTVGGSGGEATVRPRSFSAGSLFRITSGPLGWVPTDVAQSGHFTDYDTHHARYIGTDEDFLFFPQEDAQVETDVLYVLNDEFELFSPEGNLVAAEFSRVEPTSLPAGDFVP